MAAPQTYRMDKTAFRLQTVEEADEAMRNYHNHSIKERLEIAFYLTSVAYKFDMNNPPRMDKTAFCIKKHEE
ncbi:MAG: hypothetical protein IPM85_15355 [Chitinophagaceae bacterium]|nr:hypothetical protein [Chitinophagaceae bacterium]